MLVYAVGRAVPAQHPVIRLSLKTLVTCQSCRSSDAIAPYALVIQVLLFLYDGKLASPAHAPAHLCQDLFSARAALRALSLYRSLEGLLRGTTFVETVEISLARLRATLPAVFSAFMHVFRQVIRQGRA